MLLCSYILVFSLTNERRLKEQVGYLRLLFGTLDSYIKQVSNDQKRLTAAYHDMGNILSALEQLADKESLERLRKHLDTSLRFTGNIYIDAMIYVKRQDMTKQGIELTVKGAVPDKIQWLDPIDVFIIIGNALDNAVEAVSKIAPDEREPILMELVYNPSTFVVRVRNKIGFNPEKDFKSTKPESGHGYGLKNIELAANRYGGSVSAAAKDGWFALSVLMYSPLP